MVKSVYWRLVLDSGTSTLLSLPKPGNGRCSLVYITLYKFYFWVELSWFTYALRGVFVARWSKQGSRRPQSETSNNKASRFFVWFLHHAFFNINVWLELRHIIIVWIDMTIPICILLHWRTSNTSILLWEILQEGFAAKSYLNRSLIRILHAN